MKINDKLANGLYFNPSLRQGAGVGIFTGAEIGAGSPICEYKGETFEGEEEYKQVLQRYSYTMSSGFKKPVCIYGAQHQASGTWIDCHPALCKKEMGLGGFINDARNHADRLEYDESWNEEEKMKNILEAGYNCYMWPVPNEPMFLIIAIRNISPGEELYMDYGDEYWIPWGEAEKSQEKKRKQKEKEEQVELKKEEKEEKKEDELAST
jgi:hypothetical protein